jgi:hypothetical protein
VGKLEEKRPLGRSRLTWEDNTKMDQDVRWGMGDTETGLCGTGQGQVVGSRKCGNEPLSFINCGEFLD